MKIGELNYTIADTKKARFVEISFIRSDISFVEVIKISSYT